MVAVRVHVGKKVWSCSGRRKYTSEVEEAIDSAFHNCSAKYPLYDHALLLFYLTLFKVQHADSVKLA